MKTLIATNTNHEIPYPLRESEFDVQAYLFNRLQEIGLNVKGEVKVKGKFGLKKKQLCCRFDLVIFDSNKNPTLIIEVKSGMVSHKTCVEDTRQGKRYIHFGVPVCFVYGMEEARVFVNNFGSV